MQGIGLFHSIEVANMWLELLHKIKYAIESTEYDMPVMLGFYNPHNAGIDERGLIMIGRGETTVAHDNVHNMFNQEVYLEVWARCDSNVLEDAYLVIADLECKLERIIAEFRKLCGELDEDICVLENSGYQIVDLKCTNKTDDHDSIRPFIGTQYRFEVKLYNLNEDTKGGIY